jgi:DNA (cytosine-5)-methyltransferase 1
MKIATLFAGCGGKTLGAIAATSGTPIWAIEYDPQIADLYRQNISPNIIVKNILNIDPRSLESPNLLLISPPCPNFSAAKVGRIETDNDRALAAKICEFITTLYPEEILIENVRGYRQSESYATIIDQITTLGYYWDAQVFNFADFGVPQTRERLIVRASRIAPIPIVIPTHAKNPANTIFNQQQKWVGWYEAIADLIPTLPRCELANWQKLRMESRDVPGLALIERSGARSEMQIRGADRPSFRLRAMCGKMRPNFAQANILVSGQDAIIRQGEAPSFTLTAGRTVNRILVAGGGQAVPRYQDEPSVTVLANFAKGRILEDSICYRVSTPALARLQTFPDWYQWSDREQVNVKAIGNSVCCLAAEKLIKSFSFN